MNAQPILAAAKNAPIQKQSIVLYKSTDTMNTVSNFESAIVIPLNVINFFHNKND